MIDWLNQVLSLGVFSTTPLEILGFLTGIICVYLNTRQNVWGWFFSIISSLLYTAVFWQVRLYADMGLQVYYFATSIYGWWMWQFGGTQHYGISVTRTPAKLYPVFAAIFVIATLSWGFLLGKFTDASLTYADSALTIASLIGTWMLARKYVENWILWIVADTSYTIMYLYKSLHLTAILYAVLTLLAVLGFVRWKKDLVKMQAA